MTSNPLEVFEALDPELLQLVKNTQQFAVGEDGALPRKYKYLIAMALDASHGAVRGVTGLAKAAMQAGATKEEIAETIRVAQYISGVGSFYTAGHALQDLF